MSLRKNRVRVQARISVLVVFLLGFMGIVACRYAWLQLVQGPNLAERMKNQVGIDYSVQSPRGAIVDRNGRELAVSAMTKSLFVDPNHVENADALASDLAPLIGKEKQEILDDIAVGGGFSWVKRRMEQTEYEAERQLIRDKSYGACLGFRDEAKRYYPNDVLAANVIGFVGTDDKGLDGIEQAMDSYIKGEVTESFIYTDRSSTPILDSIFAKKRYRGDRCKTIELTIDGGIQFIVEQEMDKAMAANDPSSVTCVVIDPRNGDILAMAQRPSYNPNRFWDYDALTWKNRAVSTIYEPGSTFKSIVAGAALQEKIVTPGDYYVDPGYVIVSDKRIQNWNGESFGTVTFAEIVKESINTGFAQIGLKLGAQRLMHYAELFGFGQPTDIDLPGEEYGILFDPQDMVDSDIATASIGQSIAVTPLQLITAMAAIANDGVLLKPHIIKSIKNFDGSVYSETQKQEVRRVIDSATDKTLVELLEGVVAEGGGKKARVKGYRVAGKTGTAQKINENSVGYMEGHYIASFCGFAPVENPQFVVLVIIDDPKGSFYGGQISAPVAGSIFSKIFRYLRIEPSTTVTADEDEVYAAPKPSATPKPAANVYTGEIPEGKVLVPDFQGKSIREAAGIAKEKNLVFEPVGSGFATSQSVFANTLADAGSKITVYFNP